MPNRNLNCSCRVGPAGSYQWSCFPAYAGEEEQRINPRSRSAKLRVVEKL